jgi:glycerol-3-phosphate acyltransferase PlsY
MDSGLFLQALIVTLIYSYFLGSIPSGKIAGKIMKKDIQEYGSKKTGATNASRIFGKKVGLIVATADVGKTIIAMQITKYAIAGSFGVGSNIYWGLIGISWVFVAIGHVWPVWLKFKGGAAVSTFYGGLCIVRLETHLDSCFIWFLFSFWDVDTCL